MGCRVGLQQVGCEAFVWCCGRAHVQWVGMVGLECCVEVVRFSCGGLGSWWGLHTMAGLAHHVGVVLWQGFHGAGWHRSWACMPCWDSIGVVSQRVLCTMTGWWQQTCAW